MFVVFFRVIFQLKSDNLHESLRLHIFIEFHFHQIAVNWRILKKSNENFKKISREILHSMFHQIENVKK